MKVISIFRLGILEALMLTFNKKAVEKVANADFVLPMEDSNTLSEHEQEIQHQTNSLEMLKEYNVNVFTKWLFLALSVIAGIYGSYLLVNKSIVFIVPAIMTFLLYKLYSNRKEMAQMRFCLIQFIFQTQDEVRKIKETV